MYAQVKKMRYVIKGKGGQGVLFLAKVIAQTLLLSKIEDFDFLKEFGESQRNGEIIVSFILPFEIADKSIVLKEHNMIELRKVVDDLNLDKRKVEQALKTVKPSSFKDNIKVWKRRLD